MTITVQQNGLAWSLYCISHGYKSIVGPRILRGSGGNGIELDIDIHHDTREQAETAAAKLRVYLESIKPAKKKRSTAVSAFEE